MSDPYEEDGDQVSEIIQIDRSPKEIERLVCMVSPKSPLDELCGVIDAADWLLARAKAIHQLSRQIAINWIDRNGEFDIGDQHYRVGFTSVTRCTNLKQTGLQLLDDLDGDVAAFLNLLVAQPYKPGSAKRVLDKKVYGRLFIVKKTSRLINGVPERSLVRTDTRFT